MISFDLIIVPPFRLSVSLCVAVEPFVCRQYIHLSRTLGSKNPSQTQETIVPPLVNHGVCTIDHSDMDGTADVTPRTWRLYRIQEGRIGK